MADKKNHTPEDVKEEQPVQQETEELKQHTEDQDIAAEAEVAVLRNENEELRDKHLRLLAEFENYKRRNTRERAELLNTAAQSTLSALLPVLDDFDRVRQAEEDSISEGVMLVYQKLYNTLKQQGLEAMDSTGQPFDPELHDAMTEIPAPAEELKGKVVDTIEKGYTLKGKIIRHAKVVVGK